MLGLVFAAGLVIILAVVAALVWMGDGTKKYRDQSAARRSPGKRDKVGDM